MQEAWRRDVACGSDPVVALAHALRELPKPGLWLTDVKHDEDCPAVGKDMRACTCEIVRLEARRHVRGAA